MALTFRHLVIPLLIAVPTFAQSGDSREVELSFSVFGESALSGIQFEPAKNASPVTLQFYSAFRSPEYSYKGDATLAFRTGSTGEPAALFNVPSGLRRALLLFVPTPKNSVASRLPYQIIGIDDSAQRIPLQHFVFLNVSGREYEASYGGQTLSVPTGQSEAFSSESQEYLKLIAEINDRSIAVGGVQFGLGPGQRAVIVIFPPVKKTGLQPLIRTLYDEGAQRGSKNRR